MALAVVQNADISLSGGVILGLTFLSFKFGCLGDEAGAKVDVAKPLKITHVVVVGLKQMFITFPYTFEHLVTLDARYFVVKRRFTILFGFFGFWWVIRC